ITDRCAWTTITTHKNHRLKELVGDAVVIRLIDGGNRICGALANRFRQELVSTSRSLPSLVTVHGIVTTHHARDLTAAELIHFSLQRLDITRAAARSPAASIETTVNADPAPSPPLPPAPPRLQLTHPRPD